jgi:hypothetical protein
MAGGMVKMWSSRCMAARPRWTIDSIQPSAMVGQARMFR